MRHSQWRKGLRWRSCGWRQSRTGSPPNSAMGAGPELVAELETLVGQHPWRERLWAQLMTALYRSGRQGDALGAFQRARSALVDELGVEPGPELQAVEAQVLAHDAQLLAVAKLPPSLPPGLTIVGPTFVGRQAELTRLLAAYDRAAAGSVERILLTGAHGIGKTRLLAELAREAQARGALVQDHITEERPGVPVVVLLDDLHRRSAADLNALTELVLSARPPMLVVGAAVSTRLENGARRSPRSFPTSCWCRRSGRMTSLRSSGCMSRRTRSKTASPLPPAPLACRCRCTPSPAATARSGLPHKWRRPPPAFPGLGVTRRSHRSGLPKASETGNAYGWCGRRTNPLRHRPSCAPTRGSCSSTLTTPRTSLGGSASLRGSLPSWWTRAPRSRRCVGQWQVVGGPCRPGGCASCRHVARQRAMGHRVDDADPTTS